MTMKIQEGESTTLHCAQFKCNIRVDESIVKKIVERQGGTIQIQSAEGQGATFTFTWPKMVTSDASRLTDTVARTA